MLVTCTFAQTAHAADKASKNAQAADVKLAVNSAPNIIQKTFETVTSAKVNRRIVTKPLKVQNQATDTQTQGRFVIGTDNSNKAMIVYRSQNNRKAMPNLFKG